MRRVPPRVGAPFQTPGCPPFRVNSGSGSALACPRAGSPCGMALATLACVPHPQGAALYLQGGNPSGTLAIRLGVLTFSM